MLLEEDNVFEDKKHIGNSNLVYEKLQSNIIKTSKEFEEANRFSLEEYYLILEETSLYKFNTTDLNVVKQLVFYTNQIAFTETQVQMENLTKNIERFISAHENNPNRDIGFSLSAGRIGDVIVVTCTCSDYSISKSFTTTATISCTTDNVVGWGGMTEDTCLRIGTDEFEIIDITTYSILCS